MTTPANYVMFRATIRPDFCPVGFVKGFEDSWKLMRGHAVTPDWPGDIHFKMEADYKKRIKLADAIANNNDFLVASERLQKFLQNEGVLDVEYLPVTVVNHKKKTEPDPYAIVNPMGLQDCVDLPASSVVMNSINPDYISIVHSLVIDESKISPRATVFRAKGLGTLIFFRRDLADKLAAQNFSGIEFIEISSFRT